MPVSTSLQCPHCGYSTTTSKVILPNTNIRCPKCQSVFQLVPTPEGLVETIPVADEQRKDTLLEVTAAGGGAAKRRSGGGLQPKYLHEATLPPPPRTPAPIPTSSVNSESARKPPFFHGSRKLVAVLGIATLATAVAAFGTWYYVTILSLTKSADSASDHRKAVYKAPIGAPVGVSSAPVGATPPPTRVFEPAKPIGAPVPETAASPSQSLTSTNRKLAPYAIEIDGLNVSLVSAHLGRLNRAITSEYLSLRVKVTNRSKSAIPFTSWGQSKLPVILKDSQGNYYNIQHASGDKEVQIAPGKSFTDTLLFEPTTQYTQLDLDLPIPGTDRSFQFRTPPGFISRALVPLQELPSIADEAPGAPAPLPPEKDPDVRKKLIAEYREASSDIDRQARGRGFNEGNELRRRGKRDLVKNLGKKYNLDQDQVKGILRAGY
jgi:hypothetical protein